jgi:hypothetical protein
MRSLAKFYSSVAPLHAFRILLIGNVDSAILQLSVSADQYVKRRISTIGWQLDSINRNAVTREKNAIGDGVYGSSSGNSVGPSFRIVGLTEAGPVKTDFARRPDTLEDKLALTFEQLWCFFARNASRIFSLNLHISTQSLMSDNGRNPRRKNIEKSHYEKCHD